MKPLESDQNVIDLAKTLTHGRRQQEETEAKRKAAEEYFKQKRVKVNMNNTTIKDKSGISIALGAALLFGAFTLPDTVYAHASYQVAPGCPVTTQNCKQLKSDGCCLLWSGYPPAVPSHSHPHQTITETETEQGCNPWIEESQAESRARQKLSPLTIIGCSTIGTLRNINGNYIRIFSDYTTHACPKSLNYNPGISDIGRMYTVRVTCNAYNY